VALSPHKYFSVVALTRLFTKSKLGDVRVIALKRLQEFWKKHPVSEKSLSVWYTHVSHASWRNIFDIRKSFNSVDMYGRRTIFDIGGNKFRLIARVSFRKQAIYVLYVLTHAEYDEGDWKR